MRKVMIPLTLVALLGAAGAAQAAEVTGTITSISPGQKKLTLSDGYTYTFVQNDVTDYDGDPLQAWRDDVWRKKLTIFKVGDDVTIQWITVGTAREAQAISPAN